MNTLTILVAGVAGTGALAAIPLLVWPIAGRINTARDVRNHAAATEQTSRTTDELVAQIHAGVHAAATAGDDPGKLAAAAYSAASALAYEVAAEDFETVKRILRALKPILNAEGVPTPELSNAHPLAAAAALQLLLHRLAAASYGPMEVRARVAGGYTAEALRAIPDGRVLDFNPLTEHDPARLHLAQAAWIQAAKDAGMGRWERALPAEGETTVAVTR